MDKWLQKIGLFCIICVSYTIFGAQPNIPLGTQHPLVDIPLVILIDRDYINENPTLPGRGANTLTLGNAINAKKAPILVSKSIFHNYITRLYNAHDPANSDYHFLSNMWTFNPNEWELYIAVNTRFFCDDNELYLLMPKNYSVFCFTFGLQKTAFKEFSLQNMQLTNYPDLSDLSKQKKVANVSQMETLPISLTKGAAQDLAYDFSQIFLSQSKLPITWNIYLVGHGINQKPKYVSGLLLDELQVLLHFFNTKIKVGILIVSSCFAGGKNIQSFLAKKDINNDKVLQELNFLVVVISADDTPTMSLAGLIDTNKNMFIQLFKDMEEVGKNPHTGIKQLLDTISKVSLHVDSQKSNIPQVILPGGIEIQSLTPDKKVMILGNVKTRAAELEKKPIFAVPYKVAHSHFSLPLYILLYPQEFNAPLVMQTSFLDNKDGTFSSFIKDMENIPTFGEYLSKYPDIFTNNYFIFSKQIDMQAIQSATHMYPVIISMLHGSAVHFFKKIDFEGYSFNGSCGILKGIRDTFFNIQDRTTLKTYMIDEITGINDISPLIKAIVVINGKTPNEVIKTLPMDGDSIVLKNVTIRTQGNSRNSPLTLFLQCTINDRGYTIYHGPVTTAAETAWRFELSPEYTEAYYKNEKKLVRLQ